MDLKVTSLTVACKEYFGYKPGQTLGEFVAEVKELTPDDREYFKKHFPAVGYQIAA